MIKAVIFDFGQTLVDSADGFRTAEKQAQNNLFAKLGLTIREDFLTIYRRLRKEFHERFDFSRNSLWREVLYYYCVAPETGQLEKWETEYWETVKARTTIFPETEEVLESLSGRYEVALITNTQGQKTTGTHRISLFPELEKFFRVMGPAENLVLVGYSMGASVALEALAQGHRRGEGWADRVRAVTSVGGALFGSHVADQAIDK